MFTSRDVSVVVPVYGPPLHFLEALRSVAAQQPGELIVVDDGSPNPLPDLSEFPTSNSFLTRAIEGLERPGIPAFGQRLAPWITFLDADDLWVDGCLSLQLHHAQQSGAQVIFGVTAFMGSDGGVDPAGRESRHAPCMASMLMRREVALRFPQDEVHRTSEDLDFYLKLKEAEVSIARHDGPIFKYRKHDSSLTSGWSENDRKSDLVRVLAQSLARRRAGVAQENR